MNKKEFNRRMENVYNSCKTGELSCWAMGYQFYTCEGYRKFLRKCFPGFNPCETLNFFIATNTTLSSKEATYLATSLRLLTITLYWQECLDTKAYLNF